MGVWPAMAKPHWRDDGEELGQRELGAEAGDGFELVESSAGVAEAAAGDHGVAELKPRLPRGRAGGGDDGGDEQGGLVADAAGGVLVDGE